MLNNCFPYHGYFSSFYQCRNPFDLKLLSDKWYFVVWKAGIDLFGRVSNLLSSEKAGLLQVHDGVTLIRYNAKYIHQ